MAETAEELRRNLAALRLARHAPAPGRPTRRRLGWVAGGVALVVLVLVGARALRGRAAVVEVAPVSALAADLGLGAGQGLEDSADTLPPSYRVAALTAVLVRPDGTADPVVIPDQGHGFQIENDVRALLPAAPPSPRPGSMAPASPAASGSPAG